MAAFQKRKPCGLWSRGGGKGGGEQHQTRERLTWTYHKVFICSWSSTWWCAFCGLLSALFKWSLPLSHGRSGILSGRWWRQTAIKWGILVFVMTQIVPLLLVRKVAGCSSSLIWEFKRGWMKGKRFITRGNSHMKRKGVLIDNFEKKPLRGPEFCLWAWL